MNKPNILEMIFMNDSDFVRRLLADASEEEREAFYWEFPEFKDVFEKYFLCIIQYKKN